ncbi:hypothetical protein K2173_027795 [Erythroxylum novogranatense]|uniref:Uncharacterized protein n=1 Tax=Erythroxylum novogranatense TaxID=1862640 RepID=A0AAV8U0B1_9ROSI|nr:hypothetical protein K2173_027795 [Erythroxylum novogranatense]
MASVVSHKPQSKDSDADETIDRYESVEDQENQETGNSVTSHVSIKPTHSSGTLDREVVLRRIRQRKRANKVRAVLQGLFGSSGSSKSDKVSAKWVDDAFAAP